MVSASASRLRCVALWNFAFCCRQEFAVFLVCCGRPGFTCSVVLSCVYEQEAGLKATIRRLLPELWGSTPPLHVGDMLFAIDGKPVAAMSQAEVSNASAVI